MQIYTFTVGAITYLFRADTMRLSTVPQGLDHHINMPEEAARALLYFLQHPSEFVHTPKLEEAVSGGHAGPQTSVHEIVDDLRRMLGKEVILPDHPEGYHFTPAVMAASDTLKSPHHASQADVGPFSDHVSPDFAIQFDPDFSPEEVKDLLTAVADYYRGCGGAGLSLEFETEEATVAEPVHV